MSADSAPLHAQLSDSIREKIYSHEWQPGQRIPSEHDLAARYSLSRGTVRRAIRSLIDEGLIEAIHGSGTFVADSGISHPAGVRPLSFAESLRAQGKDFVTTVLEQRRQVAPPEVAAELSLGSGEEALFLRRVRTVNDEPIICQEGWASLRECPGLDEVDFTEESAFSAVERCSGRKIASSLMKYVARVAGREHGEYLGVEETAPVLVLEQVISLEDGAPVEWSFTWFKAGQEVIGTATQG